MKSKNQRNQYKPILFAIFFGLLWILFNESGFVVWIKLNNEHNQLVNQLSQLTEEEKQTIEHIDSLNNDIDYIEFLAYSKYKMIKPGEKIFRIKNRKKISNPQGQ